MKIALNEEHEALRAELRDYFSQLVTPEVRAGLSVATSEFKDDGDGPIKGDGGEFGDATVYKDVIKQIGHDGWLGIGWPDLLESGLIALAVSTFIGLKWRDLLLHAFDPVQARTVGLPVRVLHYGLLAVMSLTIVGALKAIGIVLTVALLIAPGAIAFLLTRTMGAMLFTAVGIAVGAALSGVYLSFFLDSAPGPTIVVLLSTVFVVVFILSGRRERRRSALQ